MGGLATVVAGVMHRSVEPSRCRNAAMASSGDSPTKGDKENQEKQPASLGSVCDVSELSSVPPRKILVTGHANNTPRFLIEHGNSQFGRQHVRRLFRIRPNRECHASSHISGACRTSATTTIPDLRRGSLQRLARSGQAGGVGSPRSASLPARVVPIWMRTRPRRRRSCASRLGEAASARSIREQSRRSLSR